MKPSLPALLLAVLLASPAVAATQLEASRSAVTAARQHVSEVRTQQMTLRKELNEVATRIEALKTQKKRGGELDGALKRSQELSGTLTELAQSLSAAEAQAERGNLALLTALSDELNGLRAQFDRLQDREARKQVIVKMRGLRAEREQVRAAIPAASLPALEAPKSLDSADPEDLLEQADALRDNEDKVRRQLAGLEGRIAEAREERELDRRMNEFLRDESIFDDQDRRFRLRKDSVERTQTQNGAPRLGGMATPQADSVPADTNFAGAPEAAPPITARDVNQSEKAATAPSTNTVISRSARATDARPTVGGERKGVAGNDDDNLEDLEVQRAKLKGLAEELKVRAKKLEDRARGLK